jgi:hypothetical protein
MNKPRSSEPVRAALAELPEGAYRPARGEKAMQKLRESLSLIEQESAGLVRVAGSLDEYVRQQEGRFSDLEQELNDTALLYVASYQMQARTEPKAVLTQMRELLEQLVGAELFAVYLNTPGGVAVPIASRGMRPEDVMPLRTTDGPLQAANSAKAALMVEQDPLPRGTLAAPIATVPLLFRERSIGAVVILKLFDHKPTWARVDRQLFHLLAMHFGSSLVASHLYQKQTDLAETLVDLGESLK